jgi:predicted Zn-dependent peptidase
MLKPIVLKNNLTILRLPKSSSRTCVVGFVVATGSSHEYGFFPQGISFVIERMMFRGSNKYPNQRALSLAIESIGGEFESITTEEHIHFYIHAPNQHQNRALSILTEMIQNSIFDPLTLEREKKKIIEEIKFGEEKIQENLTNTVMSDAFPETGLGQPLKGTIDTILSIKVEDIQEYLAHQFTNEKSYLVLGGNFDNKALLEKAEQEWLHYNPRNKRFLDTPEITSIETTERDFPVINYRQRGLSQTFVVLSFLDQKTDQDTKKPLNPKERVTQMVYESFLSCLLGEGIASKLWLKVVEDEVLAHYVTSRADQFSVASLFQIQAVVDNSQFTFALESILSVLESMKKTTVSINEIAKTKEIMKGKWIMEQESTIAEIIWQMDNLISLGDAVTLEDIYGIIDEIDAITVRDLSNYLFTPEKLVMTTLGTAKETRLVEKLIRRYLA